MVFSWYTIVAGPTFGKPCIMFAVSAYNIFILQELPGFFFLYVLFCHNWSINMHKRSHHFCLTDCVSCKEHVSEMEELATRMDDTETENDRLQRELTKLQQVIDMLNCDIQVCSCCDPQLQVTENSRICNIR